MSLLIPTVVDAEADRRFAATALELGYRLDNRWVSRYVDYEWDHGRHLFEQYLGAIQNQHVLEFGCNMGASAIVLALLGAQVTGVDVDPGLLRLAQCNAARYGVEDKIQWFCVPDTTRLPFDDACFSWVFCNSVLEYVPNGILENILRELDRVTRAGGIICITGTSNRLWPREVHSGWWLVNYLPRVVSRWLSGGQSLESVFPWEIDFRFGRYENLDLVDKGQAYLTAKARMGVSGAKLKALAWANRLLGKTGVSVGMLTPSISLVLRKKPAGAP